MLALTLKPREVVNLYQIVDGKRIPFGTVMLVDIRHDKARVGFNLPQNIDIVRAEIDDANVEALRD